MNENDNKNNDAIEIEKISETVENKETNIDNNKSDSALENKVESIKDNNQENNSNSNQTKSLLKRGWKFYLKVVSVFLLMLMLSFGIAIFYVLNRFVSDRNFEKLVNQKASEALGLNINFEKISVSFPSFELKNIHVATDSASMMLDSHIASVKVRPDFFSLLRGKLAIDYLSISSSTTLLDLKPTKNEKASVEKKEIATGTPDLNNILSMFRSVDVTQISLNLNDQATTKTKYNLKLNRASLSHSIVSSALPYDIDAEWTEKAVFNAKGNLYLPQKITSEAYIKIIDFNEIKKLVPKEYVNYLNGITGSNANLSLEYNLQNNAIEISNCNLGVEPILKLNAKASIPQISPLKLLASASAQPIEVSSVWPLVKGYVPAEYGLSLNKGSVSGDVSVVIDGDKPIELSAEAHPQTIEIKTKFLSDKIVLQKGNIVYDGKKLTASAFEVALADSTVKLNTLTLNIADFALNAVFGINIGIDGLLKWKNIF